MRWDGGIMNGIRLETPTDAQIRHNWGKHYSEQSKWKQVHLVRDGLDILADTDESQVLLEAAKTVNFLLQHLDLASVMMFEATRNENVDHEALVKMFNKGDEQVCKIKVDAKSL